MQPLSIGAQLRGALQLIKASLGRRGKAGAARRRILNSDLQSEGTLRASGPRMGIGKVADDSLLKVNFEYKVPFAIDQWASRHIAETIEHRIADHKRAT